MIRVYFLPVSTLDGTEQVAGEEFIHDALLDCTGEPGVRRLIQDTTLEEDDELLLVASDHRDATQEDIDRYNAEVVIMPPDPDIERAKVLLSNPPNAITQTEMWEIMRIFGRLLGIPD